MTRLKMPWGDDRPGQVRRLYGSQWIHANQRTAMSLDDYKASQVVASKAACRPGARTSGDVTVAAPEIGALGYYWKGRVLDACGLVSPEALPFLPVRGSLSAPAAGSGRLPPHGQRTR